MHVPPSEPFILKAICSLGNSCQNIPIGVWGTGLSDGYVSTGYMQTDEY